MSEKIKGFTPQEGSKYDFHFNFDFTSHNKWDPTVTNEEFNSLTNEAANIAGGTNKEEFRQAVKQLDYPQNVKDMVIKYVGKDINFPENHDKQHIKEK